MGQKPPKCPKHGMFEKDPTDSVHISSHHYRVKMDSTRIQTGRFWGNPLGRTLDQQKLVGQRQCWQPLSDIIGVDEAKGQHKKRYTDLGAS